MQLAIPATTSFRNHSISTRLPGLDALRGIATVLVVLLHAGIPYMTKPMPFLAWPAQEAHPCPVVDGLSWCSECFLMPLFFVLAGFFSNGILISRGERNFLSGRTRRLLTTQLAADLVILPACLWIWSMGWVAGGVYEPQDYLLRGIPSELEAELFGVAHLWFLQNLYIYCLMLCGISWLAKQIPEPKSSNINWPSRILGQVDNLLTSVWKPLIPAIPCALILYYDTRIVVGFYQSFTPIISKLAYYAVYFFVGAMLYRQREKLHLQARFGKTYLFVAGMLFCVALPLIHEHTTVPLIGSRLALLTGVLASFAWFTVFGLFAIGLQIKHADNSALRYLADASFWMYLMHLPFVVLSQMAMVQVPIPAMAKFLLSGITGIVMTLVTYQSFVRGCWLGNFLDGRCQPFKSFANPPKPVIDSCLPIDASGPVVSPVIYTAEGVKIRIDRPANHRETKTRRLFHDRSGVEY